MFLLLAAENGFYMLAVIQFFCEIILQHRPAQLRKLEGLK